MKLPPLPFCVLAFWTLLPRPASAEVPFLGPIPVQYVNQGEELVLDMHRFYAPGGTPALHAEPGKGCAARFDAARFELHVKFDAAAPRLCDVLLTTGSGDAAKHGVLTVAVRPRAAHVFQLARQGADVKKVSVVGDFNAWNPDATPLSPAQDAPDAYAASLPLGGGDFGYDFVVDGRWITDPTNPDTKKDELHGEHSTLHFAPEDFRRAPALYADDLKDGRLDVRAVPAHAPLTQISAVLETGGECTPLTAELDRDVIHVTLPNPHEGFVRVVAADAQGNVSNVVRCPLGDPQAFRWQDAVLYYAFTDRFADGDPANDQPVTDPDVLPPANYHGGDLRGIRRKIEEGYFTALGVNALWLAPLNRNPARAYREYPEPHRWYTGYHGYWPVSPTEIDPRFGTPDELKALVKAAHARGIKVLADLVLHHVHEEHPWWHEHPDWFGSLDLPGGRKNLRLWDEQQFTTWFEPFLPSFDFSKDEPTRALIDNTVWWATEYDLDGFRLDAVKHILPRFWWQFRAALRERVDAPRGRPLYLVGETFKDRPGIGAFVGPNMLDGQFDFPLYDVIKQTFAQGLGGMDALESARADSERVFGKESLMSPLVGNHDKARFLAYADGEVPASVTDAAEESRIGWEHPGAGVAHLASYAELELAQAYLLSLDGVPMVYYGDEIGLPGAGDPDNRRDMRFGAELTASERAVLGNFQRLGAIRREHPALRYGSRRTLLATHDVSACVRAHLQDRVLLVFNRGADPARLALEVGPELADGGYLDALTGAPLEVEHGTIVLTTPGKTAAFIIPAPAPASP